MANPRPDEKQNEQRQEKNGPQPSSSTARENIRTISDVGSRMAGSAADMTQRAAQASVEMIDRNKEAAQQLWEHSSDLFAHLARQSTDQIGRVLGLSGENAENVARRSSRSFDALLQSSDVMRSASRDLSREWFDMTRRMIDGAVGRSESLASCRTPNELIAMQLEILSEGIETALQGARKFSEISAQAATQATQKMSEATRRAA